VQEATNTPAASPIASLSTRLPVAPKISVRQPVSGLWISIRTASTPGTLQWVR
jgi:hypothetical protein